MTMPFDKENFSPVTGENVLDTTNTLG
jgi:hypothetical protein